MTKLKKAAEVSACLLLLSPAAHASVVISSKHTLNMICAGGVCSPTSKKARLSAKDLENMLSAGDVVIAPGQQAQDIEIDAAVTWSSGQRLTLDAYRSIAIDAPVVATGTGAVTIATDDGGKRGDFQFGDQGYVQFWDTNSSLAINGKDYVLVHDVQSLAGAASSNSSAFIALAADYDATPDGTYAAAPVEEDFKGTFEGLGHSISHLTIYDKSNKKNTWDALFARLRQHAALRDLNLTSISVSGGINGTAGGATAVNEGQIEHVKVEGTITGLPGAEDVAGVAGLNTGQIFNSSFEGTIASEADLGGLVAHNYGKVIACSSSGEVDSIYAGGGAQNFIGGLVGWNDGLIYDSHSSDTVSGNTPDAGYGGLIGINFGFVGKSFAAGSVTSRKDYGYVSGLVADNEGEIDQSFSTGDATGGSYVRAGGIAGANDLGAVVSRSYSTGSVTVQNHAYAGGLTGSNDDIGTGQVISSYSLGTPTGRYQTWVGGLVGHDTPGDLQSSYWDLSTSGISDPSDGVGNITNDSGVTGLTDNQLKSGLPAGFDSAIWGQSPSINNGYPYLLANPPPQ